jgi:hypothetical protein
MEHFRKVLAPEMFFVLAVVIYACGLLLNPAKVPNFQYRARLCSMDQKFHGDDEESRFKTCPMAHGHNPEKSRNSNIRHDGIPSIEKFMLMKTFRIMLKNLILNHHLGSFHHFWLI